MSNPRIAIAGAGSIGCYAGGALAEAGRDVALLARPRVIDEIGRRGLRISSFEGADRIIAADRLTVSDDAAILRDAGIVLVTVKSADTAAMAASIAQHASPDAVVVSLQNGVGNADVLRAALPGRRVLAGMVPFNVMTLDDGRIHRGSSGDTIIERDPSDVAGQLSVPAFVVRSSDNMVGVQWGKLLINLNNALNALCGLPLMEQLAQRPWRRLLADQMAEGLAAIKAEGIKPVAATPLPPGLMPHMLRLPDTLFQLVLGRNMTMDRNARSSMWDDLQRRRMTEIDYLQGVVLQIADRHGLAVPLTRRVAALVKQAESARQGSPGLTPEQVRG